MKASCTLNQIYSFLLTDTKHGRFDSKFASFYPAVLKRVCKDIRMLNHAKALATNLDAGQGHRKQL